MHCRPRSKPPRNCPVATCSRTPWAISSTWAKDILGILNDPRGTAVAVGEMCPLPGGGFYYWRNDQNSNYIYSTFVKDAVPTYQPYYQKDAAYAYPAFDVDNSILFIAALAGIDTALYEAATIDGAGRFRKMISISLPSIAPTIIIVLLMRCGQIMNIGYYAHPYSSWERGSNENGNRILRRFVPKGTDIGKLHKKELQRIEDWVNNYPRRILGYQSATDMYNTA